MTAISGSSASSALSRTLFSVRMRASGPGGMHVSGAECIVAKSAVDETVTGYARRAMNHPRGIPAEINIKVEALRAPPVRLRSLDLRTLKTCKQEETEQAIRVLLDRAGISGRAISAAFKVLRANRTMRGAALVRLNDGKRLEADRMRGVRATLLGTASRTRSSIMKKLARQEIATETVVEALTLATKVAYTPGAVAELCISDDPDYTTGYIASKEIGYLRLPYIKTSDNLHGGRVIFMAPGANLGKALAWLENTPVLINSTGRISGQVSLGRVEEILP